MSKSLPKPSTAKNRPAKPEFATYPSFCPFPDWARPKAEVTSQNLATLETCAYRAGAALGALHGIALDPRPLNQLWRQRLALRHAAALTKLLGRTEDAEALRDAWCLRRPQDDPGPAGRLLQSWYRLADPLSCQPDNWLQLLSPLQLHLDAVWPEVFGYACQLLKGQGTPVAAAAQIAVFCIQKRPDAPALALWLADAVLAKKLGMTPVPLLAAHISRKNLFSAAATPSRCDPELWVQQCYQACNLACLEAVDLYAELGRRANLLLNAAPQLRSKDAHRTVERFLREDALSAKDAASLRSERSGRRLCERLVELGLVRELTKRQQFRLYGL